MSESQPKAFICHSSADKDRFVLSFAKKLRENGIDAWVDKWEINLNDNIVDRIFEEGIKRSDVFIIVLSKHSLESRFVREELSSAFMSRLEGTIKILPVVIDLDIEIPSSLKHIFRIEIRDLQNFDAKFVEIVDLIFEKSEKPALGNVNRMYESRVALTGLEKRDIFVFETIGKKSVLESETDFLSYHRLLQILGDEFNDEMLDSVIEVLDDNYLVKSDSSHNLSLTDDGFLEFCYIHINDFFRKQKEVINTLINLKPGDEIEFEKAFDKVDLPVHITRKIVGYFERQDLIRVHWCGQFFMLDRITGPGKKWFLNFLDRDQ